ncbi:erythrocyte membrane protein 1, PfEMP1, putative [Plasmodium sp. DRC-Itaito]|nr:erythrocyte membrane protein 1, PfEMP1, putative [Plasmodium sp. DRC-Itaito]
MGNTESNNKSSLLKNFQYMIRQETGSNTKLLYFDYLNFLHYELENKAWKWEIYKDHVNGGGGGGTDHENFCAWKEIQKQIFDKLTQYITDKKKYSWDKDVLPLINIKEKTEFTGSPLDCNKITIKDNIDEINNANFTSQSRGKPPGCDLKTSKDIHVPLRRRGLLVSYIYQYLNEIKDQFTNITDEDKLKDVLGTKKTSITIGSDTKAFNLTKDVVEAIAKTFGQFIYEKHKNDHKVFCKEWERTMDDYFKLLQGIDIVNDKETNQLQCLIKEIEENVGNKEEFKREWRNYFRKLVNDLQNGEFVNPNTQTPCQISLENKSQCVRFFEEWAEEFCKLKKNLGNMVVTECGKTQGSNCKGICGMYEKFMKESQQHFDKYKDICNKPPFGNDGDVKELREIFSKAAMDYMKDCCTDSGHCSSTELFNTNADKSNIRYKCFCDGGEYHKDKNSKKECTDLLNSGSSVVTGRTVEPPTLSTASQSGTSGGSTTTTTAPTTTNSIMKIAQKVLDGAQNQWQQRDSGSTLKGDISKAKFGKSGNEKAEDVCKLEKSKHTNDWRTYEAGSNGANGKHGGPCTGKGGKGIKEEKKWEKNSHASNGNQDVLFPPRRLDMCTSNLENLNTDSGPLANGGSNINDSFTGDVLLAAKEEAAKIIELYNGQSGQSGATSDDTTKCRAIKASFADLGDIIRGKDMWGNNSDQKKLQEHLDKIFGKIHENLDQAIKDKYKNSDTTEKPPYKNLRDDWWTANRDQIWKAMKCNDTTTKCGDTPLDDYIPQELRWTTEWSEDFCNQRKKYADEVKTACEECKKASDEYHKNSDVNNKNGSSTGSTTNDGTGKNCDDKNGGGNNSSDSDCTQCKEKCSDCKNACTAYKNFVEGNSGQNNWRDQWKQMETKYTKLMDDAKKKLEEHSKTSPGSQSPQTSSSGTGGGTGDPSGTPGAASSNQCSGEKNGKDCVKSFYEYLVDSGYTTLSSYINSVTTNCGDDKPQWGKTVAVTSGASGQPSTTTNTTTVLPQPLGDKPVGFKYACDCRIPSREELCEDNDMYNTRWKCDGASGSTGVTTGPSRKRRSTSGKPTYELCHDKSGTTNDEAKKAQLSGTELDDHDAEFFISFDQWYKDIQIKLDEYMKRIMDECDSTKIMPQKPSGTTSGTGSSGTGSSGTGSSGTGNGGTGSGGATTSSGNVVSACSSCRNSCECYKLWISGITEQWKTQRENFNKFEKSSVNQGSGGSHNNDDVVDMNKFLFASCWEDFLEKTHGGKTIDTLDPTADGDMIDVLMKRCGETKDKATDKFNERIDKAQNQTTQCHKKQERCRRDGEAPKCEEVGKGGGSTSGCKPKTYDDEDTTTKKPTKSWNCNDEPQTPNSKNVCMSPRTQQLCVANMHNGPGGSIQISGGENTWKNAIQAAMKKETENLYDYYTSTQDGKGPIISKGSDGQPGEKDAKGMPKNFCLAAERTYNDFKHMVLGDSISKHETIKTIGDEIKKVLDKSDKSGAKTPQEFWEANSDEFWKAIKCGIKQKLGGSSKGDECGRYPPEDTDSQFVWWFKEWGQEFCIERQTYMDAINDKCSSSVSQRCENGKGGSTEKKLKEDCQEKCDKYKEFIKNKRSQWTQQKKKYEIENEGKEAKELFGEFPECRDANFGMIFENSGTTASVKPSTGSSTTGATEYYDASDICSCQSQTYNASGNHPSWCHPKSNDTAWRSYLVKKGTNGKKLQGVFAPPRRQKLCLANLFPINFGTPDTRGASTTNTTELKKNTLENRLQIIGEREAYFLWKQYHTEATKDDKDAHKKACCAIRKSFFDIGDIVKGIDLWHDESTRYIDGKLDEVFKEELETQNKNSSSGKNKEINPDDIKKARKTWWNTTIKDKVWDAMQNGAQNAMKALSAEVKDYTKIDCLKDDNGIRNVVLVATPQFMRWLKEWTHQFCEEYTTHMNDLQTHCNGGNNKDCNDKSNGKCKDACTKYTNWINTKRTEWIGMKNYYDTIMSTGRSSDQSPDGTDYSDVMQSTAIEYLNQKCKTEIDGIYKCCYCDKVGKENTAKPQTSGNDKPLEHIDQVVALKDPRYSQYRHRCTNCQLKHIKEQIETIGQKITEREKIKKQGANSGSSGPGKSPQNAKPVAAKPPSGGPGTSGGNVKPEVPRPQAAKPAATKPATTKPPQVTTPGGGGEPPGGKGSQGPKGSKTSSHSKQSAQTPGSTGVLRSGGTTQTFSLDSVDNGVPGGKGLVINAYGGKPSVSVQVDTGSTQPEPPPASPTPADPSSDPFVGSSSGSSSSGPSGEPQGGAGSGGGGAASGTPDGQGAGPVTTTQKKTTDRLRELLKEIAGAATTYAPGTAVLGIYGTMQAIKATTNWGMPIASTVANTGLKVAKKLLNGTANGGPGQSPAPTTVDGSVQALPAPQTSLNPGSSGTGGTGGGHQVDSSGTGGTHTVQSQPGPGPNGPAGVAGPPAVPSSQHGSPHTSQTSLPGSTSQRSGEPVTPFSGSPSVISTSDILSSTLPVGLSIALGSLALLYYLKKKTTAKSPDIFRVLEIPQKDYNIPRYKSSNRYVPYTTKYRGKTYIYMEGDDSGDDTYIGDISSSDVTTSSDSEYDELDINEIYGYGGGKHRTLIDIVLKPSGDHYTSGNTTHSGTNTRGSSIPGDSIDIVDNPYSDNTIYSDNNIHSGTKHVDTTTYSNTTTYGDTHFIIQIQDRQLGGDNNTQIYDVGGDIYSGSTDIVDTSYSDDHLYSGTTIPGNTTTYSETHVSPSGTYSGISSGNHGTSDNHGTGDTHLYSGTDLIHDSLYSDRHIDIYEELLKRKEKEQHMW